jgi:excisionase family DNA binding protein
MTITPRSLDDFADYELLKVPEVAECLRISEDLVYELVARGELPAVRLGRKIRLPAFGLKQWIVRASGASPDGAPGVVSLPHH